MWLSTDLPASSTPRLTRVQWLICAVAGIGFAFDTFEITVFAIVARPSLASFGLHPGAPEFNRWVGLLLWVPQAAGGVFGLLGGYLTDRLGRRRVLVGSIVLYGISAAFAAFSSSVGALLFWRCLTVVGACVEFVAAIAWLAETFPVPAYREKVLAYTQGFSAAGGFLVAGAYYVAITWAERFPVIRGGHDAWRYTLLCGLIPAIPLMLVRPFLPESPVWERKRREGGLRRPGLLALFAPSLRRVTIVSTVLTACSFGIAVGVIQQTPRIVPGSPDVQHLGARAIEQSVTAVHLFNNLGNLVGRLLFALLVVRIAGQRRLFRTFTLPALILTPIIYVLAPHVPLSMFKFGDLVASALMVAQLSFWGNYLPRMYPTHLRGTGESFATNVGGRLIGTSAALIGALLVSTMPGTPPVQLAYATALVAAVIYTIALVVNPWLQEPADESLPE